MHNNILAYIHIEKAAGQTFIRILENNFILRHCRVAPLHKKHKGIFSAADLNILLKFNPFLKAIAGHSVVPFSNLDECMKVNYITIFREPVQRYISHFQYWVDVLNRDITFEKFLSLEEIVDFQTKKIAGLPDLGKAKEIVKSKLFLSGVLEEFDDFLKVLKVKLAPQEFDIRYRKKNVAKKNKIKSEIMDDFNKYKDRINNNNQLDLELYDFVKNQLFSEERTTCLEGNEGLSDESEISKIQKFKRNIIGGLYRKFYMGPAVDMLRIKNGLKIGGSY